MKPYIDEFLSMKDGGDLALLAHLYEASLLDMSGEMICCNSHKKMGCLKAFVHAFCVVCVHVLANISTRSNCKH